MYKTLHIQVNLTVSYPPSHTHLSVPISRFVSCYTDFFALLREHLEQESEQMLGDETVDLDQLRVAIDVLSISLPPATVQTI